MHIWTWAMVYAALAMAPPGRLWGVPRGGQIIAGLTGRAVDTPEAADVLVDDICDSGATRDRYRGRYPSKPFWTLTQRHGEWVQFPWEAHDTTADLEETVRRQLEWLGEDPAREGLRATPSRVLKAWRELTVGYQQDPAELLAVDFAAPYDQMVCVRAVPYWSLCEHHLLPFHGTATVAYVPKEDRVVGLSKLSRLVHCFARRLQVQERLTAQIAEALQTYLDPLGAGVLLTGQHTCMQMRGIQSPGEMVTSALLGVFRQPAVRAEFFSLTHRGTS